MPRRGARVGAAAVALGLSLGGPQAHGVAAADTGQVSPGADAGPSAPAKARADRASTTMPGATGPRASGPRPAAADATGGQPDSQTTSTASRSSTSPGGRPRSGQSRSKRAHGQPVLQGPVAPQATTITAGAATDPGTTGITDPATSSVPLPPAVVSQSSRQAASTLALTAGATLPTPAGPVAALGAAVGTFLDSAVSWVSRLPGGPIADFLQGALLLARRTLLSFIPSTGSAQTGGQTTSSPYLTDAELRDYLLTLAQQRYGSLFGQTVPQYDYGYKWLDGALIPVGQAGGGRDSVLSDTNTQVDGVDEADFVETDGRYIYVARNGSLTIVGSDATLASQTALPGYVVGQFLDGDTLTVITQSGGWYGPMVKMAYGSWWNSDPQTTVTVFDIADRTAPAVTAQTVFDGAYRDSRAVDGTVYLVLDRNLAIPEPLYTEGGGDSTASADRDKYLPGPTVVGYRTYESWDSYVARVGDQITTLALPHAYVIDAEGNQVDLGVLADAGSIVRPDSADQQSLLTVLSIDSSSGPGFASGVGSFASPGGTTVYMTPQALYLATTQDSYTENSSTSSTRIDRFTVSGTDIGWQAEGVVPGTLINQFAMDERDGYLRVATHTWSSQWAGGTWATVNHSGVYVLDTAGEELDVVGSVTGLAPGEQLYAVRFIGDKGYLVTFLQTDPLFAIDMADPTAPVLEGELVIPGFSNYLQSVGDGLLLGLGQEREAGSWNTRLHVSLFDVSDGADLDQIERRFLDADAQWSWSEAQFDHHALLFSAQDGLLVVPVAAGGYDPETGAYRYGQTLQVLRVGRDGFDIVGVIHTEGTVLRTVRIGDVLYAVGDDHAAAYSLTDLSLLGRTDFGTAPPREAVPVLAANESRV